MKYDRNLVATIIENEFWDDLYNEIDDSVMNMEGQELDEAFETYVDYAELDQIENVKVVRVEQEEDDTCTIVRGILEADVSLDGYVSAPPTPPAGARSPCGAAPPSRKPRTAAPRSSLRRSRIWSTRPASLRTWPTLSRRSASRASPA